MNILKPVVFTVFLCTFAVVNIAQAGETTETPTTEKMWSMADKTYGAEEMAAARAHELAGMGGGKTSLIMADRLETQFTDGEDGLVWDAQAWYGTDENKLWIKTEGEYSFASNDIEDIEIQALWSKPISTYWDVQAGVRLDLEPKSRTHLVLGVQGIAPYWFEVDAAVFLNNKGDLTSRVEIEYDLLLNQRLILQPRAEVEISAQDITELGIGAGITGFDLGLRLRYELKREIAPYVGIEWQKNVGETASLVRATGDDPDKFAFLVGVRAWY